MVGSSPKIMSKISCESRKSREPVKVMTSPDSAMDLTRSIFGVSQVDSVLGEKTEG